MSEPVMSSTSLLALPTRPHPQSNHSPSSAFPSSTPQFPRFPEFPLEIQDEVWRFALERYERIIRVHLFKRGMIDYCLDRPGGGRERPYKGDDYEIVVEGHHTLSKLFQVCHRSRVFSQFYYRVKIPCLLFRGQTRSSMYQPGTLYFNPERDILHITADHFPLGDNGLIFIKFLHDLKTIHDPRKVGLLNLAIDLEILTGPHGYFVGGLFDIHPRSIPRPMMESYKETLRQLREVFFVHLRPGSGFAWEKPALHSVNNDMDHALPVAPMALNFTRMRHDPRPILRALSDIPFSSNPTLMPRVWRRLVRAYVGRRVQLTTKYNILLTSTPSFLRIYNRSDGQQWLKEQKTRWREDIDLFEPSVPAGNDTIKPVVGFWLFPLDAFPLSPEEAEDLDPSNFNWIDVLPGLAGPPIRWPELGLVQLY